MRTQCAFATCCAVFVGALAPAQTTSVDPYGDRCGLVATGSIEPNGASRRIRLEVTDCPPREFILFMISGAPAMTPLTNLGSPCLLLLAGAPSVQMHRTSADRTYVYSKALGQIYPIDVYVQFLTFEVDGQFSIQTSNGLHVQYL